MSTAAKYWIVSQIYNYLFLFSFMVYPCQLGTFRVNGACVCSPFVTKSGHAENPATFGPCVKSMAADFISQNAQCFPPGDCRIISSDKALLLRKPAVKNIE